VVYLVEGIKNVLGTRYEEFSLFLNFKHAFEDLKIEGEVLDFDRKPHHIRQKWNDRDNQ
jgi:hypothetical protein